MNGMQETRKRNESHYKSFSITHMLPVIYMADENGNANERRTQTCRENNNLVNWKNEFEKEKWQHIATNNTDKKGEN